MVAGAATVDQAVHHHTVVRSTLGGASALDPGAALVEPDGILQNGDAALVDLTSLDLLAQIGGDVLDQAAAHGHVEALLTAADGQHGNVHLDGLLHQVDIRGVAGVVPARGTVNVGLLIVQGGIPVLAAGDEDAVDVAEDLTGGLGVGDLRQEDGDGAVALKGLGEALIVLADGVLLPGDAHHGTDVDGRDGNLNDLAVGVEAQIGGDSLADGTAAGVGAQDGLRLVDLAHGIHQGGQGGDAAAADRDVVRHGRAVGHVVLQLAIVVDGVEDGILNDLCHGTASVDAGVFHQLPQESVAQVVVGVAVVLHGGGGIAQGIALGMPLDGQSEQVVLMLNGLHDAVGGTGHDGQAVAQLLGIHGLVVRGGHQINGGIAHDVIQPLGILGDADAVVLGLQLMVGGSAAVDQAVNVHAQMALFAAGIIVGVLVGLGILVVAQAGLANLLVVLVIIGVAGIPDGLLDLVGEILIALHGGGDGAGHDAGHAAGVDLAADDLLTQIIGDVLNQTAAHGHIEALLAAADGKQRHVHLHGLLHQIDVRGVAGVVPAGGTVGRLHLIVQGGVPVLAAGEEDAVDLAQDLLGLLGVVDLGQVHGDGAVALIRLGKSLIVRADGILLPGDAHDGTLADVGDGDGNHAAVGVQAQVSSDGLADGALAGISSQSDGGFVHLAHDSLQLRQRVETLAGDGNGIADGSSMGHVIYPWLIAL